MGGASVAAGSMRGSLGLATCVVLALGLGASTAQVSDMFRHYYSDYREREQCGVSARKLDNLVYHQSLKWDLALGCT